MMVHTRSKFYLLGEIFLVYTTNKNHIIILVGERKLEVVVVSKKMRIDGLEKKVKNIGKIFGESHTFENNT